MKVTRLLHASINVAGHLDETRSYYTSLFDLEPAPRPEIRGVGGSWFWLGDAQLHLVDADSRGAPHIDPTGPHLCFGVEDLDAAVAELDAGGVPYARASQGDVVQIWVADPSGFTIELQQDRDL